ncbi:hypothetical protein B0J11DRAFT_509200 [Dendryphion nanum]|uniref:Uncharacterized protein n=1 Tax=Dendryphion nanum TaxID=256645 RepID=A0A9P9DI71_9PLEO|nr:hypothetical protein B0J11DRAFT_509200 [Dendryphion nanum]
MCVSVCLWVPGWALRSASLGFIFFFSCWDCWASLLAALAPLAPLVEGSLELGSLGSFGSGTGRLVSVHWRTPQASLSGLDALTLALSLAITRQRRGPGVGLGGAILGPTASVDMLLRRRDGASSQDRAERAQRKGCRRDAEAEQRAASSGQ